MVHKFSRSRVLGLMFLFVASGAAALIYQVLWLKELGRLFGVTAHAAATTLAVFFLGLSAGGLAWGRRAERLRNPLRVYALLEVGIAVSALLYFGLLGLYHRLYGPLFSLLSERPTAFLASKFLLAVGVLFLPAFFMGGTLPVMAEFMVRQPRELGRMASLLYALNTVGAAIGALAAGFYLPAVLGFRNSYLVAIALNLLIAALAAWWSSGLSPRRMPSPGTASGTETPTSGLPPLGVWVVAALSGFLTLALEVLWTRMYAQVLQNSVYTFAVILTVFLVSLAVGSALANLLCRASWKPDSVLFWLVTLSGLLVALTPPVFYNLTGGLEPIGSELDWTAYVVRVFALTAAVLLVPGLVMGSVFPFLMKLSEASMRSAGRTIGHLASVNTLAAIFGSLAAGFVLLDLIGLWNSIRAMAALYLLIGAALLLWRADADRRWIVVPLGGLLLLVSVLDTADLADVHLDESRNEVVREIWEGSHGTVVVSDQGGDLRIKVNNSYRLGTSGAAPNERVQSFLPLSLHPAPSSVFYLGMGTGITAGAALAFPVDRVVVTELNPDVVRASRKYFEPWVNGLFDDSRVTVVAEDGRNYLAATTERFDVIIADIFLTYRAGVGSLYTLEHFESVASRLRPGGLFAQWLPMFDLSEEEFGIIARTMLEVFDQVTLWRRSISPRYPVYALVGQAGSSPLDPAALKTSFDRLVGEGALPDGVWLHHIPLAAYAGNPGRVPEGYVGYPLNTDDWTPLEYLSPITERNNKASGARTTLAWSELARFCEELLESVPPEADPYLNRVTAADRNQIRAGLAIYQAETFRREGRDAEAQAARDRYQELIRAIEEATDR